MHRQSISIEVCSAGRLDKIGDKYYTWYKAEVDPSQVCTLNVPYKGRLYYHKYSEKQIESLKALLILLSEKHGIDLQIGVIGEMKRIANQGPQNYGSAVRGNVGITAAWEFSEEACAGKWRGLLTHGQVRKDKDDMHPQQNLIDMLMNI